VTRKQLKLGLAAYGTGWDLDAWRLPEATNSGLVDPSVIVDLATTAERGKLDYLFAGSSLATEPRKLSRIFRWDSAVYSGYAAARTEHVGFLLTYNTSFEHPYHVARQLATLDRFSHGRAAINAVFGIDRSGGPTENFKGFAVPTEESKYRRAEEFTEILYKLLYGSWDEDFLLDDREGGEFVKPGTWHETGAEGEFFSVRGPLNVPPPIQKHIPNVHVGESLSSLEYGARYAQARFSPYYGLKEGKLRYAEQKRRVAEAGVDPDKFVVLPGINFYLAGTTKEAREKYRQILDFQQQVELPAVLASVLGLPADQVRPDTRAQHALGAAKLTPETLESMLAAEAAANPPALRHHLNASSDHAQVARDVLNALGEDERVTLGDIYRVVQKNRASLGQFVGAPRQFADWFEENLEESVFDGVQLFPPYHRGPADFFVDHVVPELQRRGIFRKEYESTRLEENLGTV
jgi:N-acetyl-S-(2-succino)cysteine monooxygenase